MSSSRAVFSPPLLAILLLTTFLQCGPAMRFYLHDRERRCFKFDAPFGSRVIGERSVANGPGTAELSVEVKTTTGKVVYEFHGSDPKDSKFAFVTPDFNLGMANDVDLDDYDYENYDRDSSYNVCLVLSFDATVHKSGKRAVTFWIRPESSQHEKPPEKHATEEGIGTVTRSLQGMESMLQQMISDLTALQQRERRLVKRAKATARNLTIFAGLALVVITGTAALQLVLFKTFFKSKKLL